MAEPEEAARAFIPPGNITQLERSRSNERSSPRSSSPVPHDSDERHRHGTRDQSTSTRTSDTPTLADGTDIKVKRSVNDGGVGEDVPAVTAFTGQADRSTHEPDRHSSDLTARIDDKEKDAYGEGMDESPDRRGSAGDQGESGGKGGKVKGRGLTEGDAGEHFLLHTTINLSEPAIRDVCRRGQDCGMRSTDA